MMVNRALATSIAAGLVGLGSITVAAPAAATGDHPTGVAFVRAWHNYNLHQDGTVAVGLGVRCVPGWQSAELDIHLHQGDVDGDAFTVRNVVCNDKWHKVLFRVTDASGAFQAGAVQTSAQFLVTNVETGDSAGAHDEQVPGTLHNHG
jgi:hypothetical protein